MRSYFISLFLYFVTCIINFYETTKQRIHITINNTVNSRLEGRVLYYAMFSKHDTELFYTCLYDHTSIWSRVQLIVRNALSYNPNFYNDMNVFQYEDVYNNVDNLTSFMIDAVIVTYVDKEQLVTRILSYKDDVVPTTECIDNIGNIGFIYAILTIDDGSDNKNEYDFTSDFNTHVCDIVNSPLRIGDFLSIFNERYKRTIIRNIAITDATLKVMADNDFTEQVFKMNDQLML
jgi:hypothetical protein